MKYEPGYREISLGGASLTSGGVTAVTVPGIWNKIESSPRALLFTGVVIDTEEYKPFFGIVFLVDSKYHVNVKAEAKTGEITVYTLEINDDDEVYCLKATVAVK